MRIKKLKIFSLLNTFFYLFLCLFLFAFVNVVNAETENKNDIKSDIKNDVKNDVKSDNKPENKTIKINVYVSYSLSEVVKEAAENFKQIYLKDNAKNDKKIDFEFNFFVNSNSMLLSKIAKDNQNFDLLFCDSQKISQIAIQKNLIHQNFAFLSDSIWVVVSKNSSKIPHNINELQDFHIHKILISQAEDDKIFKYIKNLFQQQENYKTWSVLQDQQNKIFYTTSSIQNLELLSNNQADASFSLLSEATQFIDKDKLQIAFEIDLGNYVINYFSAVNVNKDYQKDDNTKQQYEIMQSFLDYLQNPNNKNYESFAKIYKKYGYQEAKQEILQVQ